jgi:putative membrane protein
MKAVTALSLLAAALLTFAGLAGAQGLSDADREFIKKAAIGGIAEVELGNLATQRASRPTVREFGAKMVKDHGAANAELATLAQTKGVQTPTALDAEHQALRDRLMALQGPDFDRAYMQEMVRDHTQDVAEFEKASQTASDPDVKAWAAGKLPILREHLALARDVNSQLVLGPAPAPVVVVAPAAIPAAVVVPWCGGAHAPVGGTNFGTCPPVVK